MRDLFASSPIPGLRTTEEIISEEVETELVARIDAAGLTPFQFGQYEGKRLTRSFGTHYDFGRQRLTEADPIADWLLPVREQAAAFVGLAPEELVHVLLIRYDPGTGIGWHKDRPVFDRVIGLSLGAPASLAFRRRRPDGRFDRLKFPLPPRSAYLLSGEARHHWEHGIAEHAQRRYSITFRTLAG